MKKIFLIPILIILICLAGCIDSYEYTLNLRVYNNSDYQEDILITISDSNSLEIYNETMTMRSDQIKKVNEITNDKGEYFIYVSINNNTKIMDDEIYVGKDYGPVSIEIYNDEIKIYQQQN